MLCDVLKTFNGSQDGATTDTFHAGTQREISKYLFDCAPRGALRPVDSVEQPEQSEEIENKAIITTGKRGGKRA